VIIPLRAAAGGARIIHDPQALAFDPQALEPALELRRKQRTLAGGFQMLFRHPGWMLPWGHRLWWQLISHKYLRLAAPFFLLAAFLSNVLLAGQPFYAVCLAVQVCFFLIAGLSHLPVVRHWKLARLPAGFLFLNVQVLRGLRYYLAGAGRQGW